MKYTLAQIAAIYKISDYNLQLNNIVLDHVETDSRHIIRYSNCLFFALAGTHSNGHDYIKELINKGVKAFVVSKDHHDKDDSVCFFKVQDVLFALQELAIYHRTLFHIPVIGITGSNGKTIVKEWLASILQNKYNICKNPKSYNSQLGVALSVLGLDDSHQLAIFEAGISLPKEMSRLEKMIQPNIGIFTNIGDAHQAGFSGMDEKTREKLTLFANVQKCIYRKDYQSISYHRKNHHHNISWTFKDHADYKVQIVKYENERLKIKLSHIKQEYNFTLGFHDEASIENAVHCIITALELELNQEEIQFGLNSLNYLTMRLEQKEGINGCVLINDSYSLDFKSLQLALQFVDQQNTQLSRTLILSDFAERTPDDEFWTSVEYLLDKYKIQKLITVGSTIKSIQSKISKDIKYYHFSSTIHLMESLDSLFFKNELILIKGARSFQLEKIFSQLSLSKHDTILEIDLKAISHNVQVYRSMLNPGTRIMAIVKAAAYGSGHYEIAKLLEHKNIDYLAVAYPDEGIILRQKGIRSPIMVMNAGTADFANLIEYKLEPEIYSISQFHRLVKEVNRHTETKIHLKLDTGMHRLGFLPDQLEELIHFLERHPQLKVMSIFSHLAGSDQPGLDDFTLGQASLFEKMAEKLIKAIGYKPILHLLNSGGIGRHSDKQYDMIRLGIGMYGIDADPIISAKLEKVHTLKTRICQIKTYEAGQSIGYNRAAILEKKSQIGVISIGYADGLPRESGIKGYKVWTDNKDLPLIGLVCMDLSMIDLNDYDNFTEGTEIEIFGKHAPIETLASIAGTIPYEILCNISSRVKRVFLED